MREKLPVKFEFHETEGETIDPPNGWYFIHGVKNWSKNDRIGIRSPEISGSLHKDGYTKPLRSYGYIFKIDKGGIVKAFDHDITSEWKEGYEKKVSIQGMAWRQKEYTESELEELSCNTRKSSHNELWIKGDKVEIIGAYITENGQHASGAKAFLRACVKEHIPIKIIKSQETP